MKVSLISVYHLKPVVERVHSDDWLDEKALVEIIREPEVSESHSLSGFVPPSQGCPPKR